MSTEYAPGFSLTGATMRSSLSARSRRISATRSLGTECIVSSPPATDSLALTNNLKYSTRYSARVGHAMRTARTAGVSAHWDLSRRQDPREIGARHDIEMTSASEMFEVGRRTLKLTGALPPTGVFLGLVTAVVVLMGGVSTCSSSTKVWASGSSTGTTNV